MSDFLRPPVPFGPEQQPDLGQPVPLAPDSPFTRDFLPPTTDDMPVDGPFTRPAPLHTPIPTPAVPAEVPDRELDKEAEPARPEHAAQPPESQQPEAAEPARDESDKPILVPLKGVVEVGDIDKVGAPEVATPETVPEPDPVGLFNERGYVKQAPRLQDIAADPTRDNKVQYWSSPTMTRKAEQAEATPEGAEFVELTEGEALSQLDQFLARAATQLASGDDAAQKLAAKAGTLREDLHFIGDRELDEAAGGIAELWKSHLDSHRKARVCVPQGVIRTQDLNQEEKSSERLFKKVMGHFSPEERAAYGRRITTDLGEAGRRPDRTKIVLLDDWSLSGTQLDNGYSSVMERLGEKRASSSTEVHLAAASDKQLAAPSVQGRPLPTYAYFHAGRDTGGVLKSGPLVTGTHSSTDFGFEMEIEKMVGALNAMHPDQPVTMPPLTNIARRRR